MPFRSIDSLAAAFAAAREVLALVEDGNLGDPTPCPSWDVRALVDHVVDGPRVAAGLVAGVDAARPVGGGDTAGDVVAHHDETARMVLEAFGAPGALDRAIDFPFGERPASFLMFFVATDQVAHAWDLARSLGSSTDIAPDLARALLEEAKVTVTAEMRGSNGRAAFGPPQMTPKDASPADRLAAFLGRSA